MLGEVPIQCHLSRLSSPWQSEDGGCCSPDHPSPLVLLMETAWVPGNNITHWHLYKEATGRACGWVPTAAHSSCGPPGLRGQLLWGGSALPLSANCPHSPCDGPAHAALCSAHQGLAVALWMPTLPASISLVRTCSTAILFSGAG